jgi:hypothetical protein
MADTLRKPMARIAVQSIHAIFALKFSVSSRRPPGAKRSEKIPARKESADGQVCTKDASVFRDVTIVNHRSRQMENLLELIDHSIICPIVSTANIDIDVAVSCPANVSQSLQRFDSIASAMCTPL